MKIADSQITSVSPSLNSEYCSGTDITFTVTIQGTNPIVAAGENTPILVLGAYNTSTSGGSTSFNFIGRFKDVNIKQVFNIGCKNSSNRDTIFYLTFKNIKSLFYNNSTSCPQITPNQNPLTAPLCKSNSIPISFNAIKWNTYGETPAYCFGTITSYEYQLPAGWSLNGTTSTGNNWIVGSNNVTVTSDAGTGGSVLVRPANNCGTNLSNGQSPVQILISRPQSFSITSSATSITCGSTTPITFTVNNLNEATGITDYTWNLGATPNGWLYNGNPAPATVSTGTSNTITLTPDCGANQSSVFASITLNGINCTTNAVSINKTLPDLSISGPTIVCSGSITYSIANLPCNATVSNWSVSSSNNAATLTNNGTTATLTKVYDGTATLTVSVTACGVIRNLSKQIQFGTPTQIYDINVSGGDPQCYQTNIVYQFYFTPGTFDNQLIDETIWGYRPYDPNNPYPDPSTETIVTTPNSFSESAEIIFQSWGQWQVFMRPKNSCGTSLDLSTKVIDIPPYGCGWGFSASPNPASTSVDVALDQQTVKNSTTMSIQRIEISDKVGNVMKQLKYSTGIKRSTIDISALKQGLYYIRVFNGKEWKTKSIIKQ